MREIVLDTETTGLDPKTGHRIVEIACIELENHVPTGRVYHAYVNPGRDIPEEARAVHGLDAAFLATQPSFAAIVEDLLAFIATDRLIIHNAEFDLAFLNAELARLDRPPIGSAYVDTLGMARRRFPGSPANLDALCRRFSIDVSERDKHGAEIDCRLLAIVYLELLGGRQPALDFVQPDAAVVIAQRERRPARPHGPSPEEAAAHAAMLTLLNQPLWLAEG